MKIGLLIPVLLTASLATAEPGPCASGKHRQFDFWLGQWTAYSVEGKKLGTNHLHKIMGGCGMQENWQSASGGRGTSYNFYVPARDVWHQTWIDAGGGSLLLEGHFDNGSMRLEGTRTNSEGTEMLDRITWTPLEDGRVRQHWQVSTDGGETWQKTFEGYYEKHDP